MRSLSDSLKVNTQYFLPKKLLSRAVGKIATAQLGKATTAMINAFIKQYHVDMTEAEFEDIHQYKTFNDFFTRALKKGARPIAAAKDVIVSPVDGTISQLGTIYKDAVLQAKGHYYSLEALLGGDDKDAKPYESGEFATIYLSPANYHRVHMPLDGTLQKMIFVPGDLFSVNPLTASNVDNLFARNERVICFFKNEQVGEFAVVLVGATIVASIQTVFSGVVAPSHGKEKTIYHYEKDKITLKKGAELGRFLLGSTVICLFPKNTVQLQSDLKSADPVKMGRELAKIKSLKS